MNIIYYLIPVAILFVVIGVVVFFWATKSDQFDDLEKQGFSILSDDDIDTNLDKNIISEDAVETSQPSKPK